MVCNIFYNSKTAKIDSNITNIKEIFEEYVRRVY